MRLIHLSDLHLASSAYVEEWGERLVGMVNAAAADVVVVTGDLVDTGLEHEYEAARRFLDRIETGSLVVIPGNHDVKYHGGVLFEEVFGSRWPTYESARVMIFGVDSSQEGLDDGVIGEHQLAALRQRLAGHDEKTKVLALHHHLMPIPGSGRDRDMVANAGDVLKLCLETNVQFVLSGHMHRPWVWRLEGTYLISAGTATTNRFKGGTYPSFWMLDLGDARSLVETNVRDGSTRVVPLSLPPAVSKITSPSASPVLPPDAADCRWAGR